MDLGEWLRGECPACGHGVALAHVDDREGRRTLWCVHCGTPWPFPRIPCAYCLNGDPETLSLLSPDSETAYRAQLCSLCRRYLKEVRNGEPLESFPFDAAYLGTVALDLLAAGEGYIQESPLMARRAEGIRETSSRGETP